MPPTLKIILMSPGVSWSYLVHKKQTGILKFKKVTQRAQRRHRDPQRPFQYNSSPCLSVSSPDFLCVSS